MNLFPFISGVGGEQSEGLIGGNHAPEPNQKTNFLFLVDDSNAAANTPPTSPPNNKDQDNSIFDLDEPMPELGAALAVGLVARNAKALDGVREVEVEEDRKFRRLRHSFISCRPSPSTTLPALATFEARLLFKICANPRVIIEINPPPPPRALQVCMLCCSVLLAILVRRRKLETRRKARLA